MEEHTEVPSKTPAPMVRKVSTRTWIIIGVIAIAILFVGNMFSGERMAERAVEKAFEAQGIDADINVDGDGTFEYAATGEDGETVRMNAGENVTLPEGWPSNIPVPNGVTLTYAGTVAGEGDGTNYMVSYRTNQSLADIASFYSDTFKANGWSEVSNITMPDSIMLGTEYGENGSVAVYATKDAEGVAVTLTVSAE